jgi:hypothetical protein
MPGKMATINERFANVTMRLFQKHGIKVMGFWQTLIGNSDELVYLCQYEDLLQRERAWKAFQEDPEWIQARAKSEENGQIVAKVTNTILRPTSYSPLQ